MSFYIPFSSVTSKSLRPYGLREGLVGSSGVSLAQASRSRDLCEPVGPPGTLEGGDSVWLQGSKVPLTHSGT